MIDYGFYGLIIAVFVLGFAIGFAIVFLYYQGKQKPIQKEIGEARGKLRNLYDKYSEEHQSIINKIDNMLGALDEDGE